ncbi:MAG: hypothetical protein AB1899_02320 [Pseudomonadota bacterium]
MITNIQGGLLAGLMPGLGTQRPQKPEGVESVQTDKSEADGVRTANTTATFSDGSSLDRTVTLSEEARTLSMTLTGPDGETTTVEKSATRNEDGSISLSATLTGPDGAVTQIAGTRQRLENGAVASTFDITNSDGETAHLDILRGQREGMEGVRVRGENFAGEQFQEQASRPHDPMVGIYRPIDDAV